MHVRSSHVRGLAVVEESSQQLLGVLQEPLIDPDTGHIHGFFVLSAMPGTERELFLHTLDILSWGTKVHIRDAEHLSPPHELVRLGDAMTDPRTVLGQPIRTRPGKVKVGLCSDVQFDTKTFLIEWLFPRKFFLNRDPIPTTEILEITRSAIWIKDPLRPRKEERRSRDTQNASITTMAEAPSTMTRTKD